MKRYIGVMLCVVSLSASALYAQDYSGPAPTPCGADDEPQMNHQRKHKGNFMFQEFLQKIDPELYQELEKLKTEDPEIYRSFIQQIHEEKNMRQIFKGKREVSPESKDLMKALFSHELQSLKLARTYKQTTDEPTKEKVKKDLTAVLEKTFDIKEKTQYELILRMEERIVKIKELIAQRKEHKEAIVAERFKEITGENQVMEW